MFGSCPPVNTLENALGRISLVTADTANEPMSIQFQEEINCLRLAQRSDPYLRRIVEWLNGQTQKSIPTKIH